MLQLPDLTIWTIVWNDDARWFVKAGEVLAYCRKTIQCDRMVMFLHRQLPEGNYPFEVVQIPQLNWQSYNIFVNRVIPLHIRTGWSMCVHEDGFPIDFSMWDPKFLEYDFIGAPWNDRVVGNGGFCIESKKLHNLKCDMPITQEDFTVGSDRLVSSVRRAYFEEQGARFAPFEVAVKFSTEQVGGEKPSFGFHGRYASVEKYKKGWRMIDLMGVQLSKDGFHKLRNQIVRIPKVKPPRPNPTPSAGSGSKSYPIREGMKICIATTFDINYALGGATMMKSVKRHTKCDGVVFKIITSDPEVVRRFGAENCHFVDEAIKAKYGNVKYSPELPKERYHTSWYRFEIFSFEGFDRVICIDSDCICMEDISFLFSEELDGYDLVSVEDHIVSKCFTKYVPQLESQGLRFDGLKRRLQVGQIDVQPALLVANKSIVNKAWYEKLLQFANASGFTYSIDEGILNDFIYDQGLKIKLLPLEWDYQDLYEIHCPTLPIPSRPIIVHCQESKPFSKAKNGLDKRMHKWHNRWWQEYWR